MRRKFTEFIRGAWHIVEPQTPLLWNWHIDAVGEHLEAVARGQIQKLIINIPPGHLKSLEACVFWPAWVWTWKPGWRGLFASYAADLSLRDSAKCRTIVESQWYKDHFQTDWLGDEKPKWELKADQNAKGYYQNTQAGERMALGVGGKGTGFRGNVVLVDDPLNAIDAPSKLAREAVSFWWTNQMSNRINDPRKDAHVIIQQRLHADDLAGAMLEAGGYEHLCLPSEYDPSRKTVTSLGSPDKRTRAGELLFPELFTEKVLAEAKKALGADGYAGQHDQLPSAAGGGMFKKTFWNFYRLDTDAPHTTKRPTGCHDKPTRVLTLAGFKWDSQVISLDATFKSIMQAKGKDPDNVCFTVWGVLRADRFLLHQFCMPIGFMDTVAEFKKIVKLFPRASRKFVEDKANGSAVIDMLKHEIQGIIAIDPEGGKEARANAIAPQIESGNVYLPEGAGFLDEWVSEFAAFPRGKHDDRVDSTSQALLELGRLSGAERTRMMVGAR